MADQHAQGDEAHRPGESDVHVMPVLSGVDPSSPLPSPGPDQSSGGVAPPVIAPAADGVDPESIASVAEPGVPLVPVLPGVDPSRPASFGPDQSPGGAVAPVIVPEGGGGGQAEPPDGNGVHVMPVVPGPDPSPPSPGPDQASGGAAAPVISPVGGGVGPESIASVAGTGPASESVVAGQPVLPGVDPSSPLPSPGPDQASGGAAAPVISPVGDGVGPESIASVAEPAAPLVPVLPGVDPSRPASFGPDQSRLPPFDPGATPPTAGPTPTPAAQGAPTVPPAASPPAGGAVGGAGRPAPPLAEHATRNVPHTPHQVVDLGLPTAPTAASTSPSFVRPALLPMGPPATALLVGRGLMVVAALFVGVAARRSTGSGGAQRGEAFWPVVGSAGVFVAVAIAGLVYWSVSLADNAKRLITRCASPTSIGWAWLVPLVWVAVSALTYLRIDVDDQLDPLPGVAGIGLAVTLAVPYARLQGIFRGLSRRPPVVWLSAYPLDLVAFGLLWWRLTSWPDPVTGSDWDHVGLTANLAFGAAALLAVNGLVFAWLASRGGASVYERLGRLEARHRAEGDARPEWFAAGLQVKADTAPVDDRPLVNTLPLTGIVALFHVLWGVSVVAAGIVLTRLAFEYSDESSMLGELVLDQDDADRVSFLASVVTLVYVATIIVHGTWSTLVALNARRVTVHVPNPWSFGIVFTPMPVLVVAGLLIGGEVGYWVVVVGLGFAFFALLRVNQMLMNLSSRLGGGLRGFSQWTLAIALVYLVGLAENFLFSPASARLGFLATATFVQGVIIVIGGVIGFRAMRSLEDTLRSRRQARRAEPS